jgi:hypothetical protein
MAARKKAADKYPNDKQARQRYADMLERNLEATAIAQTAVNRVNNFVGAYQDIISLLAKFQKVEYKALSASEKNQIDAAIDNAYIARAKATTANYNLASIRGTVFTYAYSQNYAKKPKVSQNDFRKMYDSSFYFKYRFRGLAEPKQSWFDRAITKVGMAFGVAVVGFVTVGAGAAALGTAAPTAASAGLGAIKGATIPSSTDIVNTAKDKITDKIESKVDAVKTAIVNAPAAALVAASKPQIAGAPVVIDKAKNELQTPDPKTDSTAPKPIMAGIGLGAGIIAALLIFSKKA